MAWLADTTPVPALTLDPTVTSTASPAVTPSVTPTPGAGATTLGGLSAGWLVVATVIVVIASGVVVALARWWLEGRKTSGGDAEPGAESPDRTIIRSWLALALVGGLLLFCAASFAIEDTTLRSLLLGGLVASAGSASAFYFASKSADQARRDLLGLGQPQIIMPSLYGKNLDEIRAVLAATPLQLAPQKEAPAAGTVCTVQDPIAGSLAPANAKVTVTFGTLP